MECCSSTQAGASSFTLCTSSEWSKSKAPAVDRCVLPFQVLEPGQQRLFGVSHFQQQLEGGSLQSCRCQEGGQTKAAVAQTAEAVAGAVPSAGCAVCSLRCLRCSVCWLVLSHKYFSKRSTEKATSGTFSSQPKVLLAQQWQQQQQQHPEFVYGHSIPTSNTHSEKGSSTLGRVITWVVDKAYLEAPFKITAVDICCFYEYIGTTV